MNTTYNVTFLNQWIVCSMHTSAINSVDHVYNLLCLIQHSDVSFLIKIKLKMWLFGQLKWIHGISVLFNQENWFVIQVEWVNSLVMEWIKLVKVAQFIMHHPRWKSQTLCGLGSEQRMCLCMDVCLCVCAFSIPSIHDRKEMLEVAKKADCELSTVPPPLLLF